MAVLAKLIWNEPAVFLFLVGQAVAIAVGLGLDLSAEGVMAVNATVGGLSVLVTRQLVEPTNKQE